LYVQLCRPNVPFDGLGAFVVHDVEDRLIILRAKGVKNVSEGRDESGIGACRHWTDNDGVEVVDICNEDILHIFERPDGEGAGKVRVHCSRVCIGERGKAEHILYGTSFVGGEDVVNVGTGLDDGGLIVARRSRVGAMSSHMSFVCCSGPWEMVADERRREAGNGAEFTASVEGLEECGRRRRAEALMDVSCILGGGRGCGDVGNKIGWWWM
jgi:hypothetical protein